MTKPKKFEDLKPTELYRSAIEDFALPVDEEDKNRKTILLAAFLEGGVTWNDYVQQHPEVAEDEPNVVTSSDVAPSKAEAKTAVDEEVVIVTAAPTKPTEKYLIKMERKNPLFEIRGHRFTTDNPYGLVSPEDADYILSNIDGFRQALPSELQEYYG